MHAMTKSKQQHHANSFTHTQPKKLPTVSSTKMTRQTFTLPRVILSSIFLARSCLSHDTPHFGSDPAFLYSQSYTFEYNHQASSNSQSVSSLGEGDYSHRQRPTPNRNPLDGEKRSTNYNDDAEEPFEVVYNDASLPSYGSPWVSRVEEQDYQTDAYAFESPFDVRFFSEEELEKRQDEESDDDDDDDNDGSCSMLSNASISRVQVSSRGEESGGGSAVPYSTRATIKERTKIRGGAQPMKKSTNDTFLRNVLSVRGGALSSVSSEVLKRLYVSALVTLIFEGCLGHILEFLKIVMQTSTTKTSYGAKIKEITEEKGIGGLWDGFIPWGVVQAVSKGAVFGMAQTTASKILMPLTDQGTIPVTLALTLAGGIGGGVQGYVLSPILLLKTRVMTNPVFRKKLSLWKTSALSATVGFDLVRTEGFGSLMKGANVFAIKRVFDWATRYMFAEFIETIIGHLKGGNALSLAEKSLSSFMGGVLSTCATLPLDVLVAKSQDAKKAGVKVSALTLFTEELKEKGWSGLSEAYLSGFTARLLHVCLTVVAMKTLAPVVYDTMFG